MHSDCVFSNRLYTLILDFEKPTDYEELSWWPGLLNTSSVTVEHYGQPKWLTDFLRKYLTTLLSNLQGMQNPVNKGYHCFCWVNVTMENVIKVLTVWHLFCAGFFKCLHLWCLRFCCILSATLMVRFDCLFKSFHHSDKWFSKLK